MDRALLDCMTVGDECLDTRQKRAADFDEQVSLLLKHDWDRAKLEAGFIVGRWVLEARRWGLDWKRGKGGTRRVNMGLRWREKRRIRPVRALALVALISALAIACLAIG